MCQSSVFTAHTSSKPESINNTEKEKEKVMRKSFATALTLTVALTLATPAVAAPRDRHRSEPPSFALVVKKLIKRVFGVQITADPIVPQPAPGGGN